MKNKIVDSHAHLTWESFESDQAEVIKRAFDSGICQIVQAGVDFNSVDEQIKLSEIYPNIFNGVGLHPHEAKHWDKNSSDIILDSFRTKSVVAIGECGLDYYYKHSEPEIQLQVFREQVRLAYKLNKPLIIHTRDAWEDTFEILENEGKGQIRGVFHCYTGKASYLERINKLDFYVSFSGILTFKNAHEIQEAAKHVSLDRIMLETDSPYLAPEGKRGKRNEPSYIWLTADKLSELRKLELNSLVRMCTENAQRLFGLPCVEMS